MEVVGLIRAREHRVSFLLPEWDPFQNPPSSHESELVIRRRERVVQFLDRLALIWLTKGLVIDGGLANEEPVPFGMSRRVGPPTR
jgi:hypothetical protein